MRLMSLSTRSTLNFNDKRSSSSKTTEDSHSSSSSTAQQTPVEQVEKSSTKFDDVKTRETMSRTSSTSSEEKKSVLHSKYDEDFSDPSQSPSSSKPNVDVPKRIEHIDIESIQEDLADTHESRDTDESLSSKSSGDEQSKILVLVKKSANTTPRKLDENSSDEQLPTPKIVIMDNKAAVEIDSVPKDDTSCDVSDEEVEEDKTNTEQEKSIDRLTEHFIRVFIDEAIDQSKEIRRLKHDNAVSKSSTVINFAQQWTDDHDEHRRIPIQYDDENMYVEKR
jgi:hypothetical protein